MKLEDAVRKSMTIDGVECSSVREFISKLEKAKNLSMVVYINTKLVCSGPALLRSDNNWIIASADCQMSFKESVSVDSIRVYIKQGSNELFESVTTNCNTIIPANDTLATFYVCLGNDAPYNELVKRVPESRFTPISVNRIPDTSFDDITSTLNDGADVTVDDGSDPEVDPPSETSPVKVTINYRVGDEADMSSLLWCYEPDSGYTQIKKWGDELECVTGNTSMIRVGLLDPNKEIYVSDDGGVRVWYRYVDDEDIDSSMWDGANIVYEINFTPYNDTAITIGTKLPDDMP